MAARPKLVVFGDWLGHKIMVDSISIKQHTANNLMETATVTDEGECQTVRLPKGFHFSTTTAGVRHDGEAIVLEPLKPKAWPEGFFDAIHITDPAFDRPEQGQVPPVKSA